MDILESLIALDAGSSLLTKILAVSLFLDEVYHNILLDKAEKCRTCMFLIKIKTFNRGLLNEFRLIFILKKLTNKADWLADWVAGWSKTISKLTKYRGVLSHCV